MTVFVLTVERSEFKGEVLGVYKNEKEAKLAASAFVEENTKEETKYKKKQVDKEQVKKVLYNEMDGKVVVSVVTLTELEFDLPESKEKTKKDPNAPKKNLSAYMLFANDNRKKFKDENPEASFSDLGKLLGQKWRELDETSKLKYTKMAEEDKKRYQDALTEFSK